MPLTPSLSSASLEGGNSDMCGLGEIALWTKKLPWSLQRNQGRTVLKGTLLFSEERIQLNQCHLPFHLMGIFTQAGCTVAPGAL